MDTLLNSEDLGEKLHLNVFSSESELDRSPENEWKKHSSSQSPAMNFDRSAASFRFLYQGPCTHPEPCTHCQLTLLRVGH